MHFNLLAHLFAAFLAFFQVPGQTPVGIFATPAAPTATFIQGAGLSASSTTGISLAFGSSTAAHCAIVVDAGVNESFGGASNYGTVTDTQGNTFTLMGSGEPAGTLWASWVAPNCVGGADTVTVPYSFGGSHAFSVIIHEYGNVKLISPKDAFAANGVNGSASSSGSATVTTTASGDLLHMMGGSLGGAATPGNSGGWSPMRESATGGPAIYSWDSISGAAGNYSNAYTAPPAVSFPTVLLTALKHP